MDPKFWHERWEAGQIGFHQADIHPQLRHHAGRLATLTPAPRVLVPLCGKSLDMRFLRSLGHEVVGAELSPIAARDFFAEAGQDPDLRNPCDRFTDYQSDGITILCGDIFDLTPERAGPLHAAYDRAALVALPPETRPRYAAHLASLLQPGSVVLLIAFDYPQSEMTGPPFSVPQSEVERLFRRDFDIELLQDDDLLATEGGQPFKTRLSRAHEQTYLLTRR